jgi:hypothetical protein
MSTTTETKTTTARTRKAPAKAAAPTKAAEKKDGKVYVYQATGRAGITNRRSFPHQVAVAADVRTPSTPARAGSRA